MAADGAVMSTLFQITNDGREIAVLGKRSGAH
jgi:hypothetical protein